jgi:prophage DNA circulation protein
MLFGDWRDSLKPASFRRVPFEVLSDNAAFGRRTVRHDYPERAEPYIEDMGKAAREFSIDAYVIGDDYAIKRDNLISACETKGAGVLVHPYYGRVTVTLVGPCKPKHSMSDGRMCVFSLSFVRAGKVAFPGTANDRFTRTVTAAGAAISTAISKFAVLWTIAGAANYAVDHARECVGRVSDAVSNIKAQARKMSAFAKKVGNLTAEVDLLMLAPADLAHSILDIASFDFGGGVLTNPYNVPAKIEDFREVVQLFGYGADDVLPIGTSPSTLAMIQNQTALSQYVQVLAVALAARVAADIEFTSYNEASETQATILDKAESLMETTTDDALYQALQDMRAELVKNIEARSEGLARIVSHVPNQTVPSLRLSYDLYGSIDMESDLVARNRLRNPCMVAGGNVLEVLSNA